MFGGRRPLGWAVKGLLLAVSALALGFQSVAADEGAPDHVPISGTPPSDHPFCKELRRLDGWTLDSLAECLEEVSEGRTLREQAADSLRLSKRMLDVLIGEGKLAEAIYETPLMEYQARPVVAYELADLFREAERHSAKLYQQRQLIAKRQAELERTHHEFDSTVRGELGHTRQSGDPSEKASITIEQPFSSGSTLNLNYRLNRSVLDSDPEPGESKGAKYTGSYEVSLKIPLGRESGRYINLIERYSKENVLIEAIEREAYEHRQLQHRLSREYYRLARLREMILVRLWAIIELLRVMDRVDSWLAAAPERQETGEGIQNHVQAVGSALLLELLDDSTEYYSLIDDISIQCGVPIAIGIPSGASTQAKAGDGRPGAGGTFWPYLHDWRHPGWNKLREEYWDQIHVLVIGNDLQFISAAIQRENKILERNKAADQLKTDVSLKLGYKGAGEAQNTGWSDIGYDDATVSADVNWKLKPGENATRMRIEALDADILLLESVMSQREFELIALTRQFQRDSATAEWKSLVAREALSKAIAEYLTVSKRVQSLLEQAPRERVAEDTGAEAQLGVEAEDETQGMSPEAGGQAEPGGRERALAFVDTEVRKQIDSLRQLINAQASATQACSELDRAYTAIEIEAGLL